MNQSNFNPRSREGNDGYSSSERNRINHFNPRSREGNDRVMPVHSVPGLDNFNPRSREGNDVYFTVIRRFENISIHVPARGTTESKSKFFCLYIHFNPRSREGNDEQTYLMTNSC